MSRAAPPGIASADAPPALAGPMPGGGEPPASAFSYDAYRRFWVGTFAAVFGERFRFIAGLWLVVEITDSPFWLGVVALVQAVPTVLLSVPAGALADRIESRAILGVTYAAIGVSHLTIALLTTAGVVELWMVVVWSMTVGSLASGSAAAQNVLIPRLVERRAMASAVAYSSAIWQTTRVVGPAVAGGSVALIGSGPSLLAAALGYALAAVTIATLSLRPRPPGLALIRGGMWEGARYIARNRLFLAITGLSFFTSIFGTSYMILLPVFAEDVLGVGARGFGALEAAAGLGALAGTGVVVRLGAGRHTGRAIIGGAFSFGILVAAFSMTRSLAPGMALLCLAGLVQSLYLNLAMTALQLMVPDELRGRVMAVWTVTFFLIMVGGFVAGSAATLLGTPTAIALGSLAVSAFALAVYLFVPELRRLSPQEMAAPA
ncbi:MAG: MFS transporter [Chloroflexi bacterium]|nr:MFS transporter [Chloroflexota bacterium]